MWWDTRIIYALFGHFNKKYKEYNKKFIFFLLHWSLFLHHPPPFKELGLAVFMVAAWLTCYNMLLIFAVVILQIVLLFWSRQTMHFSTDVSINGVTSISLQAPQSHSGGWVSPRQQELYLSSQPIPHVEEHEFGGSLLTG
ncbi:hypothetical protein E2542_SST15578 [Spatholobus suberectus]|nr:hypothetical protein E2542_SST15578 [Spatholobus suberectus]